MPKWRPLGPLPACFAYLCVGLDTCQPCRGHQDLGWPETPFPEPLLPPKQNQPGGSPTASRAPLALSLTLGNLSGSPGCLGITFCNL